MSPPPRNSAVSSSNPGGEEGWDRGGPSFCPAPALGSTPAADACVAPNGAALPPSLPPSRAGTHQLNRLAQPVSVPYVAGRSARGGTSTTSCTDSGEAHAQGVSGPPPVCAYHWGPDEKAPREPPTLLRAPGPPRPSALGHTAHRQGRTATVQPGL